MFLLLYDRHFGASPKGTNMASPYKQCTMKSLKKLTKELRQEPIGINERFSFY